MTLYRPMERICIIFIPYLFLSLSLLPQCFSLLTSLLAPFPYSPSVICRSHLSFYFLLASSSLSLIQILFHLFIILASLFSPLPPPLSSLIYLGQTLRRNLHSSSKKKKKNCITCFFKSSPRLVSFIFYPVKTCWNLYG